MPPRWFWLPLEGKLSRERLMRWYLFFAVRLWQRFAPHLIRLTAFGTFPSRGRLCPPRWFWLPLEGKLSALAD